MLTGFTGTYVPTLDRLLVRREELPGVSKGGLILPTPPETHVRYGAVLAAGPGRVNAYGRRKAMQSATGDRVAFYAATGVPITLNGEDLLVMKDEDVLGVFE